MTTPTQETGQPLDFTRPLELVCDGTEVVWTGKPNNMGWRKWYTADAVLTGQIDKFGHDPRYDPGPQIVRNRAEANTPVQGDGLVIQADIDAAEEHYPPHLWRREAIMDLADCLARHRLAHQPTTDAEAANQQLVCHIDQAIERAEKHGVTEGLWLFARDWKVIRAALAHPPADKARIAEMKEIVRQVASMEGRTDAQTYWFGKARDLIACAALKDAPHD